MFDLTRDINPDRIIRLLKESGYSTYEIAKNTGLSDVAIGKIIKGTTKKPNQKTLKKLAVFFNEKLGKREMSIIDKEFFITPKFENPDMNWLKIKRMIEKDESVQKVQIIADNLITIGDIAKSNFEQLGRVLTMLDQIRKDLEAHKKSTGYSKSGTTN